MRRPGTRRRALRFYAAQVRYVFRAFFGFTLLVAADAVMGLSIYKMLQVGTCASGGPYVSARQCPDGTGLLMVLIPAAILTLFIAAWLYSSRGRAPGSDKPPIQELVVLWFWTGLFWSIAAACLFMIFSPDANPGPGAKAGAIIVAVIFIPMGAGGLYVVPSILRRRSGKPGPSAMDAMNLTNAFGGGVGVGVDPSVRSGRLASAVSFPAKAAQRASMRMPGAVDPVSQIAALQKLREAGALTDDEFESIKQQILGSGR